MNNSVHTTSAVINYLMSTYKITLKEIRIQTGVRLPVAKEWLKGSKSFAKKDYLALIEKYPELEGKIEYYENVRRIKHDSSI